MPIVEKPSNPTRVEKPVMKNVMIDEAISCSSCRLCELARLFLKNASRLNSQELSEVLRAMKSQACRKR